MASLYRYENQLAQKGCHLVAGVDEVGRGAWAGPLVAAAVVLSRKISKLRDSKTLKTGEREILQQKIVRDCDHGIGIATVDEINTHGLTWANHYAMKRAVDALSYPPDHLLVDYLRIPPGIIAIEQTPITDGDALSASIAAASIIAKVARDRLMQELHHANIHLADFAFHRNFGYGTKCHQQALAKNGPTKHHRTFYLPVAQSRQIKIKF
jgi:ribonuclease HII